jgi:hypothetical protein
VTLRAPDRVSANIPRLSRARGEVSAQPAWQPKTLEFFGAATQLIASQKSEPDAAYFKCRNLTSDYIPREVHCGLGNSAGGSYIGHGSSATPNICEDLIAHRASFWGNDRVLADAACCKRYSVSAAQFSFCIGCNGPFGENNALESIFSIKRRPEVTLRIPGRYL